MYTTAARPASVGVNQPDRMPPMMITGITSGKAAPRTAPANSPSVARRRRMPAGPKK